MDNVVSLADDFKREFKRLRKKYSSLDDDLARFIARLHENPFLGVSWEEGCGRCASPFPQKGAAKAAGGGLSPTARRAAATAGRRKAVDFCVVGGIMQVVEGSRGRFANVVPRGADSPPTPYRPCLTPSRTELLLPR